MSYDHKEFVQYESSKILKESGRVQVSPHLWVSPQVAIEKYGHKEPEPPKEPEKKSLMKSIKRWLRL